jgi:hemolysin type calcium-binding protein
MRIGLVGVLSIVALALAAPAAPAAINSTYDVGSKTLTITSDESGDTIVVTCPAGGLLVNGANPPSGPLTCSAPSTLILTGNGGADTLDVSGISKASIGTVSLDGGEGDDDIRGVFFGSNGIVVTLLAGPGNDLLTVNGSDEARGGSGDDRIDGFAQGGGGTVGGDQGTDTFALDFSAAVPVSFVFTPTDNGLTISAPGVAETQTAPWTSIEVVDLVLMDGGQTIDARGFAGSLRVDTRDGADTIYGTALADFLAGGLGNDFIDGGSGADVYQGGGGFDLLHARDGVADSGDCGSEDDTLVADAIDTIVGCERIDLPVVPDTIKPKLGLKRATLGKKKLRLPISCPASEVRCAGLLTLAVIGELDGKRVRVKLGSIAFELLGGKSKTLTQAVSVKKRQTLRGIDGARLLVKLDVLDASANRTKDSERIGLKR